MSDINMRLAAIASEHHDDDDVLFVTLMDASDVIRSQRSKIQELELIISELVDEYGFMESH